MKISKPNEPIEAKSFPDEDEIVLSSLTAVYRQTADSCDETGESQALSIETEDAGDGFFFVIKTERWAIDSEMGIDCLIEDFKKRLGERLAENENSGKKNGQ